MGLDFHKKVVSGAHRTPSKCHPRHVSTFPSGIKVQDLITRAPTLERTINETHDAVIKLQDSMDLLKPLPQQVQTIETNQGKMQIQLDNIQKQVHERK
jgi:hypothetical protein